MKIAAAGPQAKHCQTVPSSAKHSQAVSSSAEQCQAAQFKDFLSADGETQEAQIIRAEGQAKPAIHQPFFAIKAELEKSNPSF
jgi:hypothetical protein